MTDGIGAQIPTALSDGGSAAQGRPCLGRSDPPATRDPVARARELHEVYDAVLSGAAAPGAPRSLVSESWRRSLAARVDPDRHVAPVTYRDADLDSVRTAHPLGEVVEDRVDVAGKRRVLGQLPRPPLLDVAVEPPHARPDRLQGLGQLGPVEEIAGGLLDATQPVLAAGELGVRLGGRHDAVAIALDHREDDA